MLQEHALRELYQDYQALQPEQLRQGEVPQLDQGCQWQREGNLGGGGSARCRPVLILACEAILLSCELKRVHPGDKSSPAFPRTADSQGGRLLVVLFER